MIIHTPRIDLVVVVQVKGVESATEYVLSVLCAGLFNFEALFGLITCFELATNFPRISIAPCVHLLALGQSHGMLGSARDFLDPDLGAGIEDLDGNFRRDFNFARRLSVDHILWAKQLLAPILQ